jgi:hypothetical protein
MSNIMTILIVDCRYETDSRPHRLKAAIELLGLRCDVSCVSDFPRAEMLLDLVLLHAGDEQGTVGDFLRSEWVQKVPCLLYYGNSLSDDARNYIFGTAPEPSLLHERLPEPILPTGQAPPGRGIALPDIALSETELKLKACVNLILDKENYKKSPRTAVEETFGDPVLEKKLVELYDALKHGTSIGDLVKLRNDRFDKEPWE